MSDRIVRLHYEGGAAEMHCPVCGKPVFESEARKTLCAHVLFSYFDLPKVFGFVKEELKESAKAAQDYSDLWGANPVEVLMSTIDQPDTFCFALTTSGFASGSVSGTAYIGFKYAPWELP